jgi:pyridoxal biosynthesis lyase PdxS
MKTTVDIPDKELKDLMRLTKATTKREAIVAAVTDYNRRKKMAELTKYLGTCKDMMSLEELMENRRRGTHSF